jgi:hypothetical protein
MNNENLLPMETNTSDQESNEAKLRAVIMKFSRQKKIYPVFEWWDWD